MSIMALMKDAAEKKAAALARERSVKPLDRNELTVYDWQSDGVFDGSPLIDDVTELGWA